MNVKESLSLYLIFGSANCVNDPVETLEEAIHGGVTMFQFREKGKGSLTGDAKLFLAKQLQSVCKKHKIPFIVNDDVDLAIEVNADGVHVGQEDGSIPLVRRKIGAKLLGVSAHNVREAQVAMKDGADYLGVGPMFPTTTKLDIRDVQGPEIIASIRASDVSIPIVGIGGIHSEQQVKQVIDAGADGVSVISAISQSPTPKNAAMQLHL